MKGDITVKLKDRVAIITGAGMGIGKAIATRFAQEGAKVVVADINEKEARNTADEIISKGYEASWIKTDVANSANVKDLIEFAVKKYGELNILVNNAGISAFGKIPDITEDKWDKVMNINVKGVFLGCKYAIPVMKAAGGGTIINIGSVTGIEAMSYLGLYCASKGAVGQLTKCLALDHGADNIRVNCICPGAVQAPTTMESPIFEQLNKQKPLRRSGLPKEIANVAVFLASDEASYMTGSLVVVDGGETAGKTVHL